MRVAVIGASGRSGRIVVARALERGHEATAVVRSAARAPRATTVAVADALDSKSLARAVGGMDAIISCLGHVKGEDHARLLTDSTTAILSAMSTTAIRRLIVVSASGAFTGGDDPLTRYVAKPILNRLLRENMDDTRGMEAVLRASDADWTALRPSQLVDKPGNASYRSRLDLSIPWGFQTSLNTVGRAAIDALTTPAWIGHPVSIVD